GAGFLAQPRARLEHRDRNAGTDQVRGRDQSDRPGARDQDPLGRAHAARRPYSICLMPALVMMSRYLAISSWCHALILSSGIHNGSAPAFSNAAFTAGSFTAAAISLLMRSRIGCGVP